MTHENKEQLTKWLRAAPEVRGTLVRSIRFPDQTVLREGAEGEFSTNALDRSWRVVSDTFQS